VLSYHLKLNTKRDLEREEDTKMGSKIKSCSCKHEYQDAKYGRGKRVMNETADKPNPKYRCTVCGTVRD